MDPSLFISRRLRFRSGITMASIAVSYLVMIIAVAVSSGFRKEIRGGISAISGDIQITSPNMNVLDQTRPIERNASYLEHVKDMEGVVGVEPVVYRAGIIKEGDMIHGVLFKGTPDGVVCPDSVRLGVSIPKRLSQMTGLAAGDRMTAYFVGERTKVRQFNICSVYDAVVEADDRLLVHASMEDLQRLEGWTENQVSALEIFLSHKHLDENVILEKTQEVGAVMSAYSEESEAPVIASSSVARFSQLFDWLDLIDFNVLFILLLMTVVAGFNMISGLLIMLFENISTIGLLKSLGMTDRAISKAFLASASALALKGMAIGNVLAFLICIIQDRTHIMKLDPANYFVSFVPMKLDPLAVLAADAVSYVLIVLILLIPTLFVAKVDPAQTVRVK